jgi:hypothetical protein
LDLCSVREKNVVIPERPTLDRLKAWAKEIGCSFVSW